MPKGLFNWTFKDIVDFLKDNGFKHSHTEGSHFYYVKKDGNNFFQTSVPFHGSKTIKPRTLKGIILQSGISKEKWLER